MFWLPKLLTLATGTAATVATGVAVVALAGPPGPGQPGTPTTAPVAKVQPAPPAKAEEKKPEPPKPAEAEKPAGDFPELAEYERLAKLEADLKAEERRLGVRLARAEGEREKLAAGLLSRFKDDWQWVPAQSESYCRVYRLPSTPNAVTYPVAGIRVYAPPKPEDEPIEKPAGKPVGKKPDAPGNAASGRAQANEKLLKNYQFTSVAYNDRHDLAAALTRAKVARVLIDGNYGCAPEEQEELFAACKLAGIAEFYCTLPIDPVNDKPNGHFATPDIIERLAVKPLGQLPHPMLIRLDLSRLDGKPAAAAKEPADAPKVDPDYAEYERLTKLAGELRAEQARVAGRLQRVYSKRGQFFGSLLRQRDNQIESLQGDRVCVVEHSLRPGESVIAANVRRHQPAPPGTPGASPGPNSYYVTVERIDYYDRRDLAAELIKAKVTRLIVSQHHTTAVGFDDLTEILAAAKAAKVAEVYVPKPLDSRDSDAPTRELIAKYSTKPAAETPLVVRLDLANYTPPAAAKP